MNRYSAAQIIQDPVTRKRRLSSTLMNVIPASTNDIYIQVTSPDRLDKIASVFYKDVLMWPVIAVANGIGKGTLMVPANTLLRIPDPATVQQNLSIALNR